MDGYATISDGKAVIAQLLAVLRECVRGAGNPGAFLEEGPHGLFQLLEGLSASEASRPAAGSSIARHALHVAFSLDAFIEWIEGVRGKEYDWAASWLRGEVTEEEWRALRRRLEAQHARLEEAAAEQAPRNPEAAWGAAGALAHTAYHLGMIQVKADVLRGEGGGRLTTDA